MSTTTPMVATVHRQKRSYLTFGLGVWAVLVYLFLFAPIIYIVVHSFNRNRDFFSWSGFSTTWYGSMWDNDQLKDSVINSFKGAIGSTAIAVLLGTLAGVTLARRPGGWARGFMTVILLILVTPEIVDAIGLQLWFFRLGGIFVNGLWPIWIGQAIFSSAVVTLIVRARMAGMDDQLEQAAADLYATPRRAFFQITLPLIAPAILSGGLLAFTFSLDNVVITQFVATPDTTTFPVYVFGLTRTLMRPEVGAMSTIILCLTLVSLFLVALALRRTGDSTSKIAATFAGG
jgi:ABC-type spermidine/putrescine transport system permease subunit II